MTRKFKSMYYRLCQKRPEKFTTNARGDRLIICSGTTKPVDTIFWEDEPKTYLWFLHELATALGGVVWAHPYGQEFIMPPESPVQRVWIGYWNELVGDDKFVDHSDFKEYDTQLLALESAVIALGEEVMRKEK